MFKKFSNLRFQFSFLPMFFAVILFTGCGNNFVQFGGKVTTADGQPYTKGYVIFTNGKDSARAKLQPDGTYKLNSLKEGDGLAPGTYQIYLSGFQENIGTDDEPVYKSDIDLRYENPDTSNLSCEVIRGGHFDFTVDPL